MLWVSGRADGHRQGQLTAAGGVTIPYREWWRPDARAVVLYLHGQGDHSGPFTAMGDQLHAAGYSVYAHDHRGFGLSGERRGHIESYDRFVDDVMAMIRHAQDCNAGRPIFLLGQSMGGHIALRSAYRARREIQGVIALSPGLKLRQSPPWPLVLKTGLFGLVTPSRYLPILVEGVVTTRNQTHLAGASADEHWVNCYTAGFYLQTMRSLWRARREVRGITVPVLIMQAGDDYLVCPQEGRRWCESIGHPDKEFRLLEGLCHNLVAEPEMPQITREIATWIDQRLGPRRV